MTTKAQPILGFGLDAQYSERYPGRIEGLCAQFRDRLTHLSIVSLPSVAKADDFRRICAESLPIIHHLPGVAPADPDGPHLRKMEDLDKISVALDAIWVCEDIAIWSIGPYGIPYFTPPVFEPYIADKIARGIKSLQQKSSKVFLAEIPSCSIVLGSQSLGSFFHQITSEAGCPLVGDVSHIYSYAIATGREPEKVLHSLPLDSIWEIHIAGGHIDTHSSMRYIDTHSERIPDSVVALLRSAIVSCHNLKAITYEVGVGLDAASIAEELLLLEETVGRLGWQPNLDKVTRSPV